MKKILFSTKLTNAVLKDIQVNKATGCNTIHLYARISSIQLKSAQYYPGFVTSFRIVNNFDKTFLRNSVRDFRHKMSQRSIT